MATPRRSIIDPSKPCICHCVSRCVRRLLLLEDRQPSATDVAVADGDADRPVPRQPDHWKRLLSARVADLVSLFAIDAIEWSIMGNHVHLLLSTHPDLVALWDDREVAVRWRNLTPDYQWRRRRGIPYCLPAQEEEIAAMLEDPKAIAHARAVLADVSPFHKFLKQRIARVANEEDDVTGHFWEGRFKSIVAADLPSVVAHMVYIALNPVRAGLASSLEECDFASVRDRIGELRRRIDAGEFAGPARAARERLRALRLLPALSCDPGETVRRMRTLPGGEPNPWRDGAVPPVAEGLTVAAFLDEADRVGRLPREGKGSIPSDRPTAMASLEALLGTRRPGGSPARPQAAGGVLATAAGYAGPIEAALSRGIGNAIGNFSGGLASVARRAAELGRKAVWTIFDPAGEGPGRRVRADPPA